MDKDSSLSVSTNFNRGDGEEYDGYRDLGYAVALRACADWVIDSSHLKKLTNRYKAFTNDPVEGLKYFMEKVNGGIFYYKIVEKDTKKDDGSKQRVAITRPVSITEYCKNIEQYRDNVRFICSDGRHNSEIFNRLSDMIEIESFFRSKWFRQICEVNGELVIKKLKSGDIARYLASHKLQVA